MGVFQVSVFVLVIVSFLLLYFITFSFFLYISLCMLLLCLFFAKYVCLSRAIYEDDFKVT